MNATRCHDCEVLTTNGVRCHETGCPSAHVGTIRECRECGSRFEPEHARQTCCDDSCHRAYLGLPSEDEHDDGGTCCECGGAHECQECPIFA